MMLVWLLLVAYGLAADRWSVRQGETLESIAIALGDPALAAELRRLNGLGADQQPTRGQSLVLPPPRVPISGQVLHARGSGVVRAPNQPERPIHAGLSLPPGTQVCVGSDGLATLRLAMIDGSDHHDDIHLLAGTCVSLERVDAAPGARGSLVEVRTGSVDVLEVDGTPGLVTLRTPSGITVGDRGGFRVTVEPDAARTEAVSQPVAVLGAGAVVDVAAGMGTRVRGGERPEAPVPLLRGRALLSPVPGATLQRPDFSWRPTERALSYQVQIAADPDFRELLVVEPTSKPAWRPDRLLLNYQTPTLWWRVVPVDRTDFAGVPSPAQDLRWPVGIRD